MPSVAFAQVIFVTTATPWYRCAPVEGGVPTAVSWTVVVCGKSAVGGLSLQRRGWQRVRHLRADNKLASKRGCFSWHMPVKESERQEVARFGSMTVGLFVLLVSTEKGLLTLP